jgi:hypothetical protein
MLRTSRTTRFMTTTGRRACASWPIGGRRPATQLSALSRPHKRYADLSAHCRAQGADLRDAYSALATKRPDQSDQSSHQASGYEIRKHEKHHPTPHNSTADPFGATSRLSVRAVSLTCVTDKRGQKMATDDPRYIQDRRRPTPWSAHQHSFFCQRYRRLNSKPRPFAPSHIHHRRQRHPRVVDCVRPDLFYAHLGHPCTMVVRQEAHEAASALVAPDAGSRNRLGWSRK